MGVRYAQRATVGAAVDLLNVPELSRLRVRVRGAGCVCAVGKPPTTQAHDRCGQEMQARATEPQCASPGNFLH